MGEYFLAPPPPFKRNWYIWHYHSLISTTLGMSDSRSLFGASFGGRRGAGHMCALCTVQYLHTNVNNSLIYLTHSGSNFHQTVWRVSWIIPKNFSQNGPALWEEFYHEPQDSPPPDPCLNLLLWISLIISNGFTKGFTDQLILPWMQLDDNLEVFFMLN